MESQEEQIRTELMESMLDYIEGIKSFRSILALGITTYNKKLPLKDKHIVEVISELNSMGNQVDKGRSMPREKIQEIFTTMLEKLVQ